MLKTINVLIRLFGAFHYILVVMYLLYHYRQVPPVLIPLVNVMGGYTKYLTVWTNVASTVYYWIALINYLISGYKDDKDHLLRKIKDFLFFSCVFPLSTVVFIAFWILFTINPRFFVSKDIEPFLTSWLNHSVHTSIFIYAVLELLTSYHEPNSKRSHFLAFTAILLTYVLWIHIIYFMTGYWPYPFFGLLNWFGRGIFFISIELIGYGSLILSLYGNNVIWRNRVQDSRINKRK